MPLLIDRTSRLADRWTRVDVCPYELPAGLWALAPLDSWLEHRVGWSDRSARTGVLLQAGDDPALIAPDLHRLALVAIEFPVFTDGRGYSSARLLRERYDWRGELRATGDVLRDQLLALARCGFDTFELREDAPGEEPLHDVFAAFASLSEHYQATALAGPLFDRRPAAPVAAR